ncbi:sulfite exporter TauE/SafE family protein [Flavicella sediminum]|uniref:sulfite exporter TauE/SafE family protein n=1 Tax=Flavicella sediminum TaxID=2585141 RepID=UPI0011206086|nr:sulfite exporter TauE/SafE family protein [Flavicella sediminum]
MTLDLILLIIAGFFAGAINTIAGGGSLLTLPLLIFMGLPEAIANGTNRIAIFFQTASSVAGFRSKGVVTYPFSLYLGISASIGSFIGAQYAIDIDGATFKKILSIVMIVVVFLIVFKKNNNSLEVLAERTTGKHLYIAIIVFFFVGLYGGFLNAGVGFIMLAILPMINRFTLVKSNATKVTVAFIYTAIALSVFIFNGKVDWKLGLTLAIGNATGAWFASRYSVKKGDKFIRYALFVIVVGMSIKLWFYNS